MPVLENHRRQAIAHNSQVNPCSQNGAPWRKSQSYEITTLSKADKILFKHLP